MLNIISSSRYKISKKEIRNAVSQWLEERKIPTNQSINIIFLGRNKMRKIAEKYKSENEALPVLSFFYGDKHSSNGNLLGEVFVCYPQAVLLAAERNKRVNDMLIKLIKHGVENLLK